MDDASVSAGDLRVQDMGGFGDTWGGKAQLWWVGGRPGDRLEMPIEVAESGEYDLTLFVTRARDYGIFRVLINGQPVGELVDGYADRVAHSGPIRMGRTLLEAGRNTLALELVGKDVRSAGYGDGFLVGVDGFTFGR